MQTLHVLVQRPWRAELKCSRALVQVGQIDMSQYSAPADAFTMYVNTIAFTPNGQTLATGGLDHDVRFWDARNWQQQYEVVAART